MDPDVLALFLISKLTTAQMKQERSLEDFQEVNNVPSVSSSKLPKTREAQIRQTGQRRVRCRFRNLRPEEVTDSVREFLKGL